jgi:hypothetical protein
LEQLIPADPSIGDGEDVSMHYPNDKDYGENSESESDSDKEG